MPQSKAYVTQLDIDIDRVLEGCKGKLEAVVDWFRLQYPDVPLIAYPSSLILFHSDGQHHGLFLKMKDVGKKASSLSDPQTAWMIAVEKQGYLAKWADGFEKAKAILTDYMNGYYRRCNATR